MTDRRIELDCLSVGETVTVYTPDRIVTLVKTNIDTQDWVKTFRTPDMQEVDHSGNPVNLTRHLFAVMGSKELSTPRRLPKVIEAGKRFVIGFAPDEVSSTVLQVNIIVLAS